MSIPLVRSPQTRPDDAVSRAEQFASTCRGDIERTWDGYQRLFAAHAIAPAEVRDVGERTLDAVAAWAPSLADELAGIARGAGLAPWEAAALNARTEVLARHRVTSPGECSTSVYLPPDGAPPRTVQTWDWYADLPDVEVLWSFDTPAGRRVTTFTEFGVLAKIGVTDAGLGVHFNLLQHDEDGTGAGVPVHVVARRILDEAEGVTHAEELARSAPVSASTSITVVADGEAAVLELSPTGVGVQRVGAGEQLLHTNHFLDRDLARGDRLEPVDADTAHRLHALDDRRPALRSADVATRAAALRLHREDGAALCCHPEPGAATYARWQTRAVVALDLGAGELVAASGQPCRSDLDWQRA